MTEKEKLKEAQDFIKYLYLSLGKGVDEDFQLWIETKKYVTKYNLMNGDKNND